MSGGLRVMNRLLAILIGLVLIVLGAAAIAWWSGALARLIPSTPSTVDVARVQDVTDTTWWIWVALLAGLGAIALAVRWLIAHVRTDAWGPWTLAGSSPRSRLMLDTSAVASHYAKLVGSLHGVHSCRARVLSDRDAPVLEARTRIATDADLHALIPRIVHLTKDAQRVLGIDPLGTRHRLSVSPGPRASSRAPR